VAAEGGERTSEKSIEIRDTMADAATHDVPEYVRTNLKWTQSIVRPYEIFIERRSRRGVVGISSQVLKLEGELERAQTVSEIKLQISRLE
jgi:hypothetical protein